MSNKKNPFRVVNRLGMKLTILSAIIILASDILSFTAAIVVGFLTGGTNNTTQVVGSVIASVFIGALMAFAITNIILKPLSELVKATKRVTGGDFNVSLEIGWAERRTLKELRELLRDFNEMTEELRNTEMFRNDFISNFSHEFKTPLVSIRGFARQLYEGNLTEEQQREFSKIILDETEYLSVLSQNTLLMTNLENKDIVTEKTDFSLDEQLRDCMICLEPQWSEKNIDIDMDLDEVRFYWNRPMLAHVWNNLFDNAVKFTPNGGSIHVSCRNRDGFVVVTVKDSGCGIPENAVGHIFEKFYQVDASHATKGNGLGLPLVKKIVELCGGDVSVNSKLGKGTEFTVRLRDKR
ncbi:MAG: HAMP domain-containing histidine kinase [Oscillospiraceae bacterium]|nr:HAMP domain-containing histidine kinase [Oscillospiraceae bacterium]